MTDKNITVTRKDQRKDLSREETRAPERYAIPTVDILEGVDGLTMYIDLPGVARDDLTIDLEQGVLTIEGRVNSEAPAEDIYREFTLARFYRQFRIPEGIDQEKVTAAYTNGVLNLLLPRAEAAKPRRIEIASGE
ncbi:ATP-independent chaperone, alpha-crystallin/Hsp20 family [Syntrophotalea carbinolica DSM 2380]|uniref:ATP-independent chaperone, alpha-crystallin/Hsp20 family n=1 Tax=Syntrophotalea carbinolica (strain DSM 2380 / NBRC 103641 / GraBd1) TaxID=338963 RepID=Q3A7M6_SYNC1|nr:Hsp20/alpha crystallin family protein [Syntrophotalea carbinolica]ABA87618.1 ATP-independent chaperone, alpha-crystallin/Hsp20 family [Syntrophotalea carbinolica DSM 2380]